MATLIKTETTQMDKTIVETKMINLIIVWLGIMFASYHFIAYPFYSITTRILQLKSIWDNVIYNENNACHCNFEIKNFYIIQYHSLELIKKLRCIVYDRIKNHFIVLESSIKSNEYLISFSMHP